MEFGVLGVSYKEASVDIRDLTAFTDTEKMELYNRLLDIAITPVTAVSSILYMKQGSSWMRRKGCFCRLPIIACHCF